MSRRLMRALLGGLLVLTFGLVGTGNARAVGDDSKTVGGYTIYLGVLPAPVVAGHSREHPEGKMHGGGAPAGRNQYHLVVAVFDATTAARIEDAQVTARVGELGLAQVEKRLEPMPIAGAMSYGNYFPMAAPGPYRIDVRVGHPGSGKTVEATFTYSRPR